MSKVFLVLLSLIISISAHARRSKKSHVYMSLLSESLTDIKASGAVVAEELSPNLNFEFGLRLTGGYSLLLTTGQSTDGFTKSVGLGGRANFPGFFMIGANRKDLKLRRKKFPLNTSAFFILGSRTGAEGAPNAKTITTTVGLNMDIFLFNPLVFLQVGVAIFNYEGNAFLNTSVGLGIEL